MSKLCVTLGAESTEAILRSTQTISGGFGAAVIGPALQQRE
ncbi:hypothetical protein [Grimontia sp. NTOU-MAR1]|nr:hypothetical protein [Grimontia sp. NTOU-MAR1]WRV99613.1 hypothetical protein VP504_07825 [Grimontia sp. NTOU-MAR1]